MLGHRWQRGAVRIVRLRAVKVVVLGYTSPSIGDRREEGVGETVLIDEALEYDPKHLRPNFTDRMNTQVSRLVERLISLVRKLWIPLARFDDQAPMGQSVDSYTQVAIKSDTYVSSGYCDSKADERTVPSEEPELSKPSVNRVDDPCVRSWITIPASISPSR